MQNLQDSNLFTTFAVSSYWIKYSSLQWRHLYDNIKQTVQPRKESMMAPIKLRNMIEGKRWFIYREVIKQFADHGNLTISELAQYMNSSIPYVTKAVNELVEQGMVHEVGKRENISRRPPRVYGLVLSCAYFLGIDMGQGCLNFGICDFCGNLIDSKFKIPFRYANTEESLNELVELINNYIEETKIEKSLIQNVCMGVGGRVKPKEGKAYNCFTYLDMPLATALTEKLGLPLCLDNDTRCMTYGELLRGCCQNAKNVIFVNVSWGLGIGIVFDGHLYLGKSGYSGEIGHMHIYNNGIICRCGKVGCMETETSGSALQRKVNKLLMDGGTSILSEKVKNKKLTLNLSDIIEAIKKEDVLCIEALQNVAVELGINLAGIINVFNPELLVIGGDLSVMSEYLLPPIYMGIKKYSLNMVSEDSQVVTSSLGAKAGLIGACLMARGRLLEDLI